MSNTTIKAKHQLTATSASDKIEAALLKRINEGAELCPFAPIESQDLFIESEVRKNGCGYKDSIQLNAYINVVYSDGVSEKVPVVAELIA